MRMYNKVTKQKNTINQKITILFIIIKIMMIYMSKFK